MLNERSSFQLEASIFYLSPKVISAELISIGSSAENKEGEDSQVDARPEHSSDIL